MECLGEVMAAVHSHLSDLPKLCRKFWYDRPIRLRSRLLSYGCQRENERIGNCYRYYLQSKSSVYSNTLGVGIFFRDMQKPDKEREQTRQREISRDEAAALYTPQRSVYLSVTPRMYVHLVDHKKLGASLFFEQDKVIGI